MWVLCILWRGVDVWMCRARRCASIVAVCNLGGVRTVYYHGWVPGSDWRRGEGGGGRVEWLV
eukprot:3696445-Prymnesium_polylepis.2